MRKLLLSLTCMLFMAGVVIAGEMVSVVKYNKETKEVTVKDKGGKEMTAKITEDTKVVMTDKDGNKKEGKIGGIMKRLESDKAEGMKLDVTVKDGVITEIMMKGGKGKKKDDK